MNQYRVTIKRIEEFYQSIFVEASTEDEARHKTNELLEIGEIVFDYFKESDILEEYIVSIDKL